MASCYFIANYVFSFTVRDFVCYVLSLPSAVHPQLKYQLDWDNDLDRDLRQIAHHMLGWDLKLATLLSLLKLMSVTSKRKI